MSELKKPDLQPVEDKEVAGAPAPEVENTDSEDSVLEGVRGGNMNVRNLRSPFDDQDNLTP